MDWTVRTMMKIFQLIMDLDLGRYTATAKDMIPDWVQSPTPRGEFSLCLILKDTMTLYKKVELRSEEDLAEIGIVCHVVCQYYDNDSKLDDI